MTLVIPRMVGAVAGFIERFGRWPTMMLVPLENWERFRLDPSFYLDGFGERATITALFDRLKLVPVNRQMYLAIDQEGRAYDYANDEMPQADWWTTLRESLDQASSRPVLSPVVLSKPISNSYVVPGTALAAGEYPGSPPHVSIAEAESKLRQFLDAGIRAFVDLTDPRDGLTSYVTLLQATAARQGADVTYDQLTIRDNDVCDPGHMKLVLDTIDLRLSEGRPVYVHCWGGIGRTGMVIGCWLVRRGQTGEQALDAVNSYFRSMSVEKVKKHHQWGSPQTEAQRNLVRRWADQEAPSSDREVEPDDGFDDGELLRKETETPLPPGEAIRFWCQLSPNVTELAGLEDVVADFGVEVHGDFWPCRVRIDEKPRALLLHVYPVLPLEHIRIPAMLEAVARANFALEWGNFEYDLHDGELRFRANRHLSPEGISVVEFDEFIEAAVNAMASYYPAFVEVLQGESPEVAIGVVEGTDDDDADEDDEIDLDEIIAEMEALEVETVPAVDTQPNALWELFRPHSGVTPAHRDRMRGALIGLAVGDAVGTAVEFKPRGTFPAVKDMLGGGPFGLAPGQWTDDTSMALCLAESLIERREFDPADQMDRYVRWWKEGHLSSTGQFVDIGGTVKAALIAFQRTGEPYSGPTGEMNAGNGSLMRLAPIPIFCFGKGVDAIQLAADSSRTTHGAQVAVDACRYLAALISGAIHGAPKGELLSPLYAPEPGYWEKHPLHPVIEAIALGSYKVKAPPQIIGGGYAAHALEAALWAFHQSDDFRGGCLLAVNLGDDADTTAAIFGQIAGAFYGESGIPAEWRSKLALKPLLDRYAEMLFQLSFDCPPAMGPRNAMAKADAEEMITQAEGSAAEAIRRMLEQEAEMKRELGLLQFYGGPLAAQAMRDERLLNLRVALGLEQLDLEVKPYA